MEPWVDTHCHLQLVDDHPDLSAHDSADLSAQHSAHHSAHHSVDSSAGLRVDELLTRASNVRRIVVPGVDAVSSQAAKALESRYPDRIRYAAGLHPHDAGRWSAERAELVELMQDAVAVGETGLDFYRNLSPRDAQISSFVDHHALARELSKPLIVHCRDAFRDIHEILERHGSGSWVVMHCWTGGPKWSKRFSQLGVTFSFAGPVAFETGDTVRRGAAVIDPGRVMVETDTPYLAPPPHRHEPNEPAHVALVGAALAGVWSLEVDEVASLTTTRATEVFGLEGSERETAGVRRDERDADPRRLS